MSHARLAPNTSAAKTPATPATPATIAERAGAGPAFPPPKVARRPEMVATGRPLSEIRDASQPGRRPVAARRGPRAAQLIARTVVSSTPGTRTTASREAPGSGSTRPAAPVGNRPDAPRAATAAATDPARTGTSAAATRMTARFAAPHAHGGEGRFGAGRALAEPPSGLSDDDGCSDGSDRSQERQADHLRIDRLLDPGLLLRGVDPDVGPVGERLADGVLQRGHPGDSVAEVDDEDAVEPADLTLTIREELARQDERRGDGVGSATGQRFRLVTDPHHLELEHRPVVHERPPAERGPEPVRREGLDADLIADLERELGGQRRRHERLLRRRRHPAVLDAGSVEVPHQRVVARALTEGLEEGAHAGLHRSR